MARKASSMDTTQSLRFNDSLQMLEGSTEKIAFLLKNISDYNREYYKFNVRSTITNGMTREEEQTAAIKAKFDSLMPGAPFYRELIEEIIKEDFDDNAPAIQAALFKRLTADVEKEKGLKKTVVLKPVLIQGLNALGSAATTIAEIMIKTQENHELIQSRKKGLLKKIAALFTQFTNKENDGAMYIFDTFDTLKNTVQKTELHYASFMAETERKNKILAAMAPQGMAAIKLKTMDESQLTALLKKNLRDVLALHKMFCGLDDYFKRAAPGEVRSRIKGIKPELSALKNAHAQANQKLIAYEQERENAEQYKKLGVRMVHV
jgi:hypothetical protein